jgi:hypothetical protein
VVEKGTPCFRRRAKVRLVEKFQVIVVEEPAMTLEATEML